MSLPYPIDVEMTVYEDDGQWEGKRWFKRSDSDLQSLFTVKIKLGHYKDRKTGERTPAYTSEEWDRKSAALVEQYPNHIFVYASNKVAA